MQALSCFLGAFSSPSSLSFSGRLNPEPFYKSSTTERHQPNMPTSGPSSFNGISLLHRSGLFRSAYEEGGRVSLEIFPSHLPCPPHASTDQMTVLAGATGIDCVCVKHSRDDRRHRELCLTEPTAQETDCQVGLLQRKESRKDRGGCP